MTAYLPRADLLEDRDQSVHVHHLSYTIVYRLSHQRMVGDLSITGDVLQAGRRIRKRRCQEVLRFHALKLGREPTPVSAARDRKCYRRVPAPVSAEHRRIEQRLDQNVLHRLRLQESEDILEREGVLRSEREEDGLVGRGGLQLEIELATEALSEREPPCAIHPAAEWGVDDELHPARLVEESLGDDRLLSRQGAEHALGLGEVVHELASRVGSHRLVS